MTKLLKIFVLVFIALGFVACDKVSDTWESIQLSMAKQCVSEEDKIKGCVEVKEIKLTQDDIRQTRIQYKDGKSVYSRELKNDVLMAKKYLEEIDNNYIVRIRLINTTSPVETHCISSKGEIIKDDYLLCNDITDNTEWRKTWCDGKLCENCEFRYGAFGTRYINGVCEKFDDMLCFANGKEIKCDEQEKQRLLSQDFSDFYKRCVSDNFSGFTIYPAPCKEE